MMKRYLRSALLGIALASAGTVLAESSFSYQGRLDQAGSPVNGLHDLRFTLYASAEGGDPVSGINNPVTSSGIDVADGLVDLTLDFGDLAFTGAQRWLQVEVRPAGSGEYTALRPRQPVTPALYAIHADDAALTLAVPANSVGSTAIDSSQVQRRITGNCPVGQAIAAVNADGSVNCAAAPASNITEVRGRNGISGSGSSGTVALALEPDAIITSQIANSSVGTAALADGAVRSSKIAPGSVTVQKVDTGEIQRRVPTECPGNRVFRRITVGGTAECNVTNWDGIANNAITGDSATVSGGANNTASGGGSVVSGGVFNTASGTRATVTGGAFNHASGQYATVTGGSLNGATGYAASVLGGFDNCAGGSYSLAMGRRAKVRPGAATTLYSGCLDVPRGGANGDSGTFIFADSQDADFVSTGTNQFLVRAQGGVYFTKGDSVASIPAGRFINTETGAHLTTGGTWTNSSSRVLKTAFTAVDPGRILDKVLAMPLTTWEYIKAPEAGRHLGPVAEDFHALFGLGDRGDEISTSDAGGVALAAIQGLAQRQQAGLETLSQQAGDTQRKLRADIAALRARIEATHAGAKEAMP